MTSEEVQEMINDIEDQIERFGIMNTMKLQLSVLKSYKQDLERLEALEKEKEYLKTTNEALNEMLLQASNEAIELETENEQLKDSIQIKQKQVNKCIDTLTQKNEKLKKAIECMKKYYKIVVCECDFPIYEKVHTYTLGIRFHDWSGKSEGLIDHIFKEEYELLKEVLGDV